MRKIIMGVVGGAVLLLILGGCFLQNRLPIGKNVIVQFDRSALGAGASLPISPTTGSINGANTAMSGKLVGASDEWLQIETTVYEGNSRVVKRFWISRDKVLLLQVDDS